MFYTILLIQFGVIAHKIVKSRG